MRIGKWWLRNALAIAGVLLFLVGTARAQTQTNVTATIQDPLGIPYANGTFSIQLIPTGNQPTVNGNSIGGAFNGRLDATGSFNVSLWPNGSIVPGGTQWQFTICIPGGVAPPLGTGGQCTPPTNVTIAGASQSLSATLSAVAPKLTTITIGGGSVTSVAGSAPIVATPNPITGAGTISCPTCGVGSVTTTGSPVASDLAGFSGATSISTVGTAPWQFGQDATSDIDCYGQVGCSIELFAGAGGTGAGTVLHPNSLFFTDGSVSHLTLLASGSNLQIGSANITASLAGLVTATQGFTAGPNGVNPGAIDFAGNTVNPALGPNQFAIFGPPLAAFTSWSAQFGSAIPANNHLLTCVVTGTNCLISDGGAVPTGTVTSVSFTGGLISVATPTTTPALTVAGTSGGVPYFNSASTWASSGILATNALVVGGGAGAAPATGNGDFTYATHTLTGGASGLVDFSALATTAGFKIPVSAGAVPTADGFLAVNSTTHALVSGSNGTTIVEAAAATGTGTSTTCTNQFVTVISAVAAPTCASVTSASITSLAESKLTGSAAATSITETGTGDAITRIGVETGNLTSGYVVTNGNSTNNNTSIGEIVGATGTSTGGIAQVVFNVSGTGDLVRWYAGGSVSAGVYTVGTLEMNLTTAGILNTVGLVKSGTDNSALGGFQASNSAANAHTIWSSSATTTNTVAGPTTVINGGELINCSTTSTTCTLQDSGLFTGSMITGVQSCGSTSSCSHTALSAPKVVIGSAALVSGTPSTVTISGLSPAFTSTGSYFCTVSFPGANATTALLGVTNVSSSSFTITGPATVTTVVSYICVGN